MVILTERDGEAWYDSYYKAHRLFSFFPEKAAHGITHKKRTNAALPGCEHVEAFPPWPPSAEEREQCIASFRRHSEKIKATVRPDSLLVYDVREGWPRLCAFLQREIPTVPFPHRDDVKASNGIPLFLRTPSAPATLAVYVLFIGSCFTCGTCWRNMRRLNQKKSSKLADQVSPWARF